MILYEPGPVLEAMRDTLAGNLPDRCTVVLDTAQWDTDQVILELVSGPTPESIHWGGHDWSVIGVQATSVGADRADARLIGGRVRATLVGQDRHGRPLHPVTPAGGVVDSLTTVGDGRLAQDNPATWVETFTVRYQAVTAPA